MQGGTGLGSLADVADEVAVAALGEGDILGQNGSKSCDGDGTEDRFTSTIFWTKDEIGDAGDDGQAELGVDERAAHAERVPEHFGERLARVVAGHTEGDG